MVVAGLVEEVVAGHEVDRDEGARAAALHQVGVGEVSSDALGWDGKEVGAVGLGLLGDKRVQKPLVGGGARRDDGEDRGELAAVELDGQGQRLAGGTVVGVLAGLDIV